MKKYEFKKALPVWQKDMDKVMHHNLVFRTIIDGGKDTIVNISACNMYQSLSMVRWLPRVPQEQDTTTTEWMRLISAHI